MKLTSQRGVSLLLLIIGITVFAGVAIGIVTLLRPRYESYPYQVQSYQASTLAQAGAEFAVRYAKENANDSGNFVIALTNLIASTWGRFNLGDGAFQLTYVTSLACKDILYSRGCSTRFNADGTCPGATREVKLSPFGSVVGRAITSLQITSAISAVHYDYGFGNYRGSRIGFNFCDFTPVYSLNNQYIPHATITGMYGDSGFVGTIAATCDNGGTVDAGGNCINPIDTSKPTKRVTLGRLGFIAFGGGVSWIWDTACGPCLGPGGTFVGQLLPAWNRTNNPTPLPAEVFPIVPVPHSWYAHTRWPTSGADLYPTFPQDRPHSGVQCVMPSGPCSASSCNCCVVGYASRVDGLTAPICDGSLPVCCEPSPGNTTTIMNCIDTAGSSGMGGMSRTEATCSGEVSTGGGMGLMGITVQVPGGGQTVIETLGDITPPVTFFLQFPYLPVDVQGCETGTNCRTLWPPVYVSWVFTVKN
jgi:hypothetical protein